VKNRIFTTIVLLLLVPMSVFALDINLESNTLMIKGDFDKCEINNEKRGDHQFCSITISDYSSTADPGKALLPLYSQLISLPPTGNYILENIKYDYNEITLDMPILHCGWEDDVKRDKDFYTTDEWYPKEIVTISKPVIMRGYRFCQISIAAVQYNPAKNIIRILKNVDAKFTLEHSIIDNPLKDTKSRASSSFSKIVSEHIYGAQKDGITDNGSYLIITPDACVSTLQSLVQWKRKLGHEVTITALSEIGGSPDNYDIKNYIQNAYLSWDVPPEFVILVGDVTGNYILPSFYVDGYLTPYDVTDHTYTLLDGTDYFPDVFIGRISIQSLMDLTTIISKIIKYESTLVAGDWYDEALMISCIDPEYGMYTHYITKLNIGSKLLDSGFQVDFFTYPMNVGIPQLIDMIDGGYSLINFRGFGSPNYWSNSYGYHFLNSSDIPSLNNVFMLPMLTSMTCGGGDFAYSDADQCFGEMWMKEGSPSNPKGAIGFIGPSERDTQTQWNNCNDMGIYQGIMQEGLYRCGEMLLRGKIELYMNFPHNHAWGNALNSDQFYFYVYNLLGDPGLQVWTDVPENITLITESTISEQQNYLAAEVDVENDKSDFMVALTKGDTLVTKGLTNENGSVVLFADFSVGFYQITASKYGYLPEINDLIVYSDDQLELTDVTFIDDPISGNTIEYELTFYNPVSIAAENIVIYLSSEDEALSVITDSIAIPSIPSNTSHTCEDLYIEIDEVWQDGKTASLDVQIASNLGDQSFIIPVEILSAELVLSNFLVQNADTCLIQNQEDDVIIELTNTGSVSTDVFTATLLCTNEKVAVTQDESIYNTIPINGTGSNSVLFSVLPDEVITGEIAQFELQITQNDSLVQCLQFSIPIGIIGETSPSFSNYGYYAIESNDTGFFTAPVYDWVELNPSMGGQGNPVYGDYVSIDGYTKILDLPFIFTYFGEFYETISISSSGWISMGEEIIYHRNRTIPSGCGPAAMIAPFWDNLQNGQIFAWFDESEHRFIVEWQAFENYYDPSAKETFEVILYDPEYYPTPNGDGEILFQYQTILNVDQDENYATVGIENFSQTDGVLLTYSNIYSPTAQTLQNETAILFTIKEGPEIPLLEVSPQSLEFTIPSDTTATGYLTITNTSSTKLSYSLEASHFSREDDHVGRNIYSDVIISTVGSYVPVIPLDLLCYLYHFSADNEPVYGVAIDFPDGVYVNGAMDIESLYYNGQTGNGAEITWGFGNGDPIYSFGAHGFNIYLVIDEDVTSIISIDWYIEGDGTGAPPHTTEGTLTLQPSTNSYLYVKYPNGGETLVYGTTDTIRWYSYGDVGNVSLSISDNNGATWENIAQNIPNSGEYPFVVEAPLGDNYRVRVKEYGSVLNDVSDTKFSINIFDITHPENGDILEYNTLDTLCWNFSGIYSEVILEFSRDNGYTWDVVNDALPNIGEYEYTVPGPPSNWCIFRLIAPDHSISNRTQGIFTIVDSPIDWLEIGTTFGTLAPGESENIPIHVTTQDLETGYYEAYVWVTSGVGQKINIPVTLKVIYATDDETEEHSQLTAYPNPFSNSTTISYNVNTNSHELAQIKIYNVKGQLVKEINSFPNPSLGMIEVFWDGTDECGNNISSGFYFYQVKIGEEIIGTNKCLLMKD